jgi:hypothetical protein
MRQLHNAEFSVRYLDDGIKILIFKAASGETIGVEVDEATATRWASQIVAPGMPTGHERFDRGGYGDFRQLNTEPDTGPKIQR